MSESSSSESWQTHNDAYLSAALTWLRLRLRQLAPAGSAPVTGGRLFERLFGQESPTPTGHVSDADVERAAQALAAAEKVDPPPAALILSRRLGLSRFEREVLLLCAAMDLDTRIAGLCARAQDDPSRPYPTFALALALSTEPAWDALSPERPLRYWRLLEINQPGALPLTASPLRADERIVNYLKGLNYLDDRLAPLLAPLEIGAETVAPPPSQQALVAAIGRVLQQTEETGRPPVVQLVGPDSLSKQLVARQVAADFGLQLLRLPAGLLPPQAAELETLARLWERESLLLPLALYLDAHGDGDAATEGAAPPLEHFLARCAGLVFLDTREARAGWGREGLTIDVDKPTPAEQRVAWETMLGPAANTSPALLAGQFNLNLPTIHQLARTALAGSPTDGAALEARLWEACLTRTRPRLDQLAQRLEPQATWDDIVLPAETVALLHQIAAQVRQRSRVYDEWGFRARMNRGLGISALFGGESGTGKTMAAEVIANELHLNLYRIDLSAVVSKYIGETEKNLRRLFDAAEDGGAILFFDEADAIFGKRSEVKDSHDRYANIEINYLLQRMEAYRGLAILATNMKSLLDVAFMRRLRFIVNFPFPGVAERRAIWQKVFPPETPRGDLDYDRLARLNLSGGNIHAIAVNAAFLAAQRDQPVTMALILEAARTEFRKLERPVNEAEFR